MEDNDVEVCIKHEDPLWEDGGDIQQDRLRRAVEVVGHELRLDHHLHSHK